MKYRLIQAATALLFSLVLGAWSVRAAPTSAQPAAAAPLAASGTVEADSVRVTTQVAGRIESMPVDEGDEVQSGQVVAHLWGLLGATVQPFGCWRMGRIHRGGKGE